MTDRITHVRIGNVRTIASMDLELSRDATVLIGENGAGKSTIVECLELLRRAAEPQFMHHFYQVHRGMPSLLRRGTGELRLGVVIEDDAALLPKLDYEFVLAASGAGAVVRSERLLAGPTEEVNEGVRLESLAEDAWDIVEEGVEFVDSEEGQVRARILSEYRGANSGIGGGPISVGTGRASSLVVALDSLRRRTAFSGATTGRRDQLLSLLSAVDATRPQLAPLPMTVLLRGPPHVGTFGDDRMGWQRLPEDTRERDSLAAASLGFGHGVEALDRLLKALSGIEVHLGFDSLASWAARTYQRVEPLRGAGTLFPAQRLVLLGSNLASAWFELRSRSDEHWRHTLEILRLGLGERVESVVVTPDAGGGSIHLALRFRDLAEPVFATALSDGQLAWLSFVAIARLNTGRSLLVVDEPELHLHPALLGRAVTALRNLDGGAPVLLSTHSDRVLELLDDPVDALRHCELRGSEAVISRLDAEGLPGWLAKFGDVAQLRNAGLLDRVLKPQQEQAAGIRGEP